MYSDFFDSNTVKNIPVLEWFKYGLDNLNVEWTELSLETDILDNFKIIDELFDCFNLDLSVEEKNFIYHSVYTLDGFKNSIEILNDFLKINLNNSLTFVVTESLTDAGRFYTIQINQRQKEVIKDTIAFESAFENLVKDLLYYNNISYGFYDIYFNVIVDLNNTIEMSRKILNRKCFRFDADYATKTSKYTIATISRTTT